MHSKSCLFNFFVFLCFDCRSSWSRLSKLDLSRLQKPGFLQSYHICGVSSEEVLQDLLQQDIWRRARFRSRFSHFCEKTGGKLFGLLNRHQKVILWRTVPSMFSRGRESQIKNLVQIGLWWYSKEMSRFFQVSVYLISVVEVQERRSPKVWSAELFMGRSELRRRHAKSGVFLDDTVGWHCLTSAKNINDNWRTVWNIPKQNLPPPQTHTHTGVKSCLVP